MGVAETVEAVATLPGHSTVSSLAGGEPVGSVPAELSCGVEARLVGPDFEIHPNDWEQRSFLGKDEVRWRFQVKPLRSGASEPLTLTIRSFVTAPELPEGRGLAIGPNDVEVLIAVSSTPGHWYDFLSNTGDFIRNNVWVAVPPLLAILTFLGISFRSRSKSAPVPTTNPERTTKHKKKGKAQKR